MNGEFELLGRVYSEDGVYRPNPIAFTLINGKNISQGEVVCIEHPHLGSVYVFYQVVEVPLKRKVKDYEEDLVKLNKVFLDPERNYPRALAEQIGYIDPKTHEIRPLLEHIKPLSEVYRPPKPLVEKLLRPDEKALYLEIGKLYPHEKLPLYLDLRILLRQGLLVIGGVGTGKTTTMISLLIKLLNICKNYMLKPHVLIIDKDGEYGCEELVSLANSMDGYNRIDINDLILTRMYNDARTLCNDLLASMAIHPSSGVARALRAVVESYMNENKKAELSSALIDDLITIAKNRLHDAKQLSELRKHLLSYKRYLKESVKGISPIDIVSLLKEKTIVHIDCSQAESWYDVVSKLASLLEYIYEEALRDKNFGCLLIIDEAHFYVPERGTFNPAGDAHKLMEDILVGKIATTGARNGVVVFATTQRLSLVKKTFSTQLGQNLIAHKVEDVDLERLKEIAGTTLVDVVRILPRGYALIKATANPLKRPIIARIEKVTTPLSASTTCLDRWRGN